MTKFITIIPVLLLTMFTFNPVAKASDRMRHGSGRVWTYVTVKERTDSTVKLSEEFWIGSSEIETSSADVLVDCPNKGVIYQYSKRQNVWKADGNLWYTDSFEKRQYNSTGGIGEMYEFACNGKLPSNGEWF